MKNGERRLDRGLELSGAQTTRSDIYGHRASDCDALIGISLPTLTATAG
jgi:hypothetical protein